MKNFSVELDMGKISYVANGRGPVLILLHSLGVSSEAWSKVFGSFAQDFTVYALDLLGHGDSDKPLKNYFIEDHAKSVIAFMDKLGLEKAVLCGNSVGALIGLEIAATQPKRVEKLILVGCPARIDIWERIERLILASSGFDVEGNPKPLTLSDLGIFYANPTPKLLEWANQQRANAGPWVIKTMIAISLYEIAPKLPLVKCPTLILFGGKDFLQEQSKILQEGIKKVQYVIVEGAGHLPQIENPQVFLQRVNQFVNASY